MRSTKENEKSLIKHKEAEGDETHTSQKDDNRGSSCCNPLVIIDGIKKRTEPVIGREDGGG